MAGLGTFLLQVGIDSTALQRGLNNAQSSIENFGRRAESMGTKLSLSVSAPLGLIAKSALDASAEFESLNVSFGVMLKSVDKGKQLMQDIQKFNLSTPFEFKEVAAASKSLLAFGFSQEKIIPNLSMIGDLSSALGINIKELADLYGKAKVQGTLFAEDINQMTGRGIPIIAEFAKQLGVSEMSVKKLASEGKISFTNLEKAFVSMTSKGGQFFNMTAAQSQTLSGVMSNFSDSVSQSMTVLGDSIVKNLDLKSLIGKVGETIGQLTKSFTELSPEVQKTIMAIGGIAIVLPPLLAIAGTVLPAISMGLIALISPAGLAGLALAGAATYAITHWNELKDIINETGDSLNRNYLTLRFYLAQARKALDPVGGAKDMADVLQSTLKFKQKQQGTSNVSTDALGNYYANKDGDNTKNILGTGKPKGGQSKEQFDAAKKLAEETKKVREDLLNATAQAEIAIIQDSFSKQRAEANKAYLDDIKAKKDAIQGKKGLDTEYTNWFIARYEEMQIKLRAIQADEFKTPNLIKQNLIASTQKSLGSQSSTAIKAPAIDTKGIDFQKDAQSLESFLKLAQGTVNNLNFSGYTEQAQIMLDSNQTIKDSFSQMALSSGTVIGEMIVNMASGTATIADLANSMLATVGNIFADLLQQLAVAQLKIAIVQGISGNPLALIKGIGLGIASGAVGALSKKVGQNKAANNQPKQNQGASVYSVVRGGDIYTAQNRYQTIKGF